MHLSRACGRASTVLVPPGYSITLDHSGNLIGEATDGDR